MAGVEYQGDVLAGDLGFEFLQQRRIWACVTSVPNSTSNLRVFSFAAMSVASFLGFVSSVMF